MSDAKDPKKVEAKAEEAPKAGGGGNKLLTILVGVNSLLLVGVMAFLVLQMRQQSQAMGASGEHAKVEKKVEKEEPEVEKKSEEKHGEGGEEGKKEEGHGASEAGVAGKLGPLVKVADFVIHLRNPDADRYARMSFDVEVFSEADKDRLLAQQPKVRDAFITYLSDRTLEDLRGSEGLARTKETLQNTLRQVVPDTRIRALYISEFVIQ
jgi:flagellar FliL protein